MKQTLLSIGLLISISCFSQKKDTIQYLPDSVNTISVRDMQKLLDLVATELKKNEWDIWQKAFATLFNFTEQKRIKKPEHKK